MASVNDGWQSLRMIRFTTMTFALLGLSFLWSEPSQALSCAINPQTGLETTSGIIPEDGAESVPLNTWIFIGGAEVDSKIVSPDEDGYLSELDDLDYAHLTHYSFEEDLTVKLKLQDADGERVGTSTRWLVSSGAARNEQSENFIVLIPDEPLSPNTTYTVSQLDTKLSTFTTSTTEDISLPAAPSLDLEETQPFQPGCSDCNNGTPARFEGVADYSGGFLIITGDGFDSPGVVRQNIFDSSSDFVSSAYSFASVQYSSQDVVVESYGYNDSGDRPVNRFKAWVLDTSGNVSDPTSVTVDANPGRCLIYFPSCSAGDVSTSSPSGFSFATLLGLCVLLGRRRRD